MAIYDLKANLDLKQNMNIYATCKQLDNLNLILYIYDNSVQVDLSSYTVRLKAMKADKVPLVQEHTGISISGNIITIETDEQLTTTSGKTLIELQFIDNSTGKKKATFNLVLIVIASTLADGTTISKSTYTLLEELENKMDQASNFFENIDEAITANNNLQDSISTGNTLKTNLDNNITTGNTLNNDLETNISAGNILKPGLEGAVTSANTAKAELDISIQDANTFVSEHGDIIDLDNRVTQNTEQLNDVEIKNKNKKIFKPKLSFSSYWGEASDLQDGTAVRVSRDNILKDIISTKNMGIEDFTLVFHISYNKNINQLFYVELLEDMEYAVNKILENGLNVNCIKIHQQAISKSNIEDEIGVSNFLSMWTESVMGIVEKFKNYNINYLTIMNEVPYLYGNVENEDYIINLIQQVKTKGYKVGITCMGIDDLLNVCLENIKLELDILCFNHYQNISNLGDKITVKDCELAWKTSYVNYYIDALKKYNKQIIMSETGTQDFWCALTNPSVNKWEEKYKIETNGEAPKVYYEGLFNSNIEVDEVWTWYKINYPQIKKLVDEYIKGEYYND